MSRFTVVALDGSDVNAVGQFETFAAARRTADRWQAEDVSTDLRYVPVEIQTVGAWDSLREEAVT